MRIYPSESIWKENIEIRNITKQDVNILRKHAKKNKMYYLYNMLYFINYNISIHQYSIPGYDIYEGILPYRAINKMQKELKKKGLYKPVVK